ncbi:hypothetical protein, partial [Pseudomonas syringae group genomosp. 3]|uniref:hypothetical protein n=1 Tax=Pseudomonas syringae group genomosp. 3 TaxID=251701 RepID=UPI001C7EABE0
QQNAGAYVDKKKKITLDQVEVARRALAALPNLSQDRMSKGQFLSALADRFHTLSQEKGYSRLAIQEALRTIGVRTCPARIALLVTEYARRSKKREHGSKH